MFTNLFRPRIVIALFCLALATMVVAGGGAQNVLVVVNANSSESLEIGNAYRRARNLPYQHLLTLKTSTGFSVSYQTYLDEIEGPIRAYLSNSQLNDDITTLVLTRGVPQMVTVEDGRATASLLAAMNVPNKPSGGTGRIANPYFGAAAAFSHHTAALKDMYLATVLDGYHTSDVLKLIALGAAADGTAPDGRFIIQTVPRRQERANDVAKMLSIRNLRAEVTTTPPDDRNGLMAYFSPGIFGGLNKEMVTSCVFRPGAIADMVQKFSAAPNNFDETVDPVLLPVSWFVQAGVTGIHGVVGDPDLNTYPLVRAPGDLLDKYTSGFSLAESFYAALPTLNGQDMVIGDPLCAPYAQRPVVDAKFEIDPSLAALPLKGVAPLRVSAFSPLRGNTISRMDVDVDGHFRQTIYEPGRTQIALYIGEEVVHYTVPHGATLSVLLDGLAAAVNDDPILNTPDGVQAVAAPETSALLLQARKLGADANEIPIGLNIESDTPASPSVLARIDGGWLSGGGQDPNAASAVISLVGRHLQPGDVLNLQVQQEHLSFTVPAAATALSSLPTALATLVNNDTALQGADGVVASCGHDGMPYLVLQARTPGAQGNTIACQVAVKPTAGSPLRAYPDIPFHFSGGHDGSAATQAIRFLLGAPQAQARFLLDTTELADGTHRVRVVAYDGSLSQQQGTAELTLLTGNQNAPPIVTLPATLPPACGETTIPVTASVPVVQVDMYVDGQLLGSATAAPFSVHLPLTRLGRGLHDLWAEGVDRDGHRYVTAMEPLLVLVPPEVSAITPNFTSIAGGTAHRIFGMGFQPNCAVKLAGISAQHIDYRNSNEIDVISAAGPARLGSVEVSNPDGTASGPGSGFEYYHPAVADAHIEPAGEVVAPGRQAQFTVQAFDQHNFPITANFTWEATGGTVSSTGRYTADITLGSYVLRISRPDSKQVWEAPVTVGPAKVTDGQLRHWLVLGPFLDPDYTALETSLLPEATISPSHDDASGQFNWRTLYTQEPFMDLAATFSPNINVAAYAHVYLQVPEDTKCALVYGSDDGIRVWLNGALIQSLRVRRAADPNQNTTPIILKAGWNRLLLKIDQATGGWGFFMRVLGEDGKPLPNLSYALDNPTTP